MKLIVVKDKDVLRPIDERSFEELRKIKDGRTFICEIKRPRNLKHHRKYWSLINLISDNLDGVTPEGLSSAIKMMIGHVVTVQFGNKSILYPDSISFDKMNQDQFNNFYERAVKAICEFVIPGLTEESVKNEIFKILGE
jgi:hypothetical protein